MSEAMRALFGSSNSSAGDVERPVTAPPPMIKHKGRDIEERRKQSSHNNDVISVLVSAKAAAHALKKKKDHDVNFMRTRTAAGIVSAYGIHRIKVEAKLRPEIARGFFAASKGKPFIPIGGPIDLTKKNQSEIAAETLANMRGGQEKTDLDRMKESEVVPIDDMRGFSVSLPPRSSMMLRVRLSDLNEALLGRRGTLARSILIAMLDPKGNPDLFMTTEEKLPAMGIPRREKHVWHSKDTVQIKPTDPNYSRTYYITVTSGVESCKFTLIAITDRYIPTINSALKGMYRPTGQQKHMDIGKTVIHPALMEADFRRKNSRAGCFPLAGYPLPHSIFARKGDDPTMRPMSALELRDSAKCDDDFGSKQGISRDRSGTAAWENGSTVALSPQISTISNTPSIQRKNTMKSSSGRPLSAQYATPDMSLARSRAVSPGPDVENKNPMLQTRPRSALERVVDVTFKCTLGRVEVDYDIIDVKTVHFKAMKGLLKPRKATFSHVGQEKKQLQALFGDPAKDLRANKESFEEDSNPAFEEIVPSGLSHKNSVSTASEIDLAKNQVDEAVADAGDWEGGLEVKDGVRDESSNIQSKKEKALSPGASSEPNKTDVKVPLKPKRRKNAPPLKVRINWTPFRADLLALLAQSDPITRKMAGYQYNELMTPTAAISGYAVIHSDESRKRKLITAATGSATQLRHNQTMLVQAGMELPFGADAIVESKFVVRDTDVTVSADIYVLVKDMPIRGQHVKIEVRPYYVGETSLPCAMPGGYMPARDYVELRYPHLIPDYDTLFRQQFLPVEQKKLRETVQVNDEILTPVLQAIESSSSPLFQTLNAAERRSLANHCRIDVFDAETVLAREGDCEEVQGRSMRQMYILVQGEMVVNKFSDPSEMSPAQDINVPPSSQVPDAAAMRTPSAEWMHGTPEFSGEQVGVPGRLSSCASVASTSASSTADVQARVIEEANRIEVKQFGRRIGNFSKPGSLFGEKQLLFGEPWPVTLRGITGFKMLVIPLTVFSQIILERPAILEGMTWLLEAQTFASSQNHVDLLLAMGESQDGRVSPSRNRSADPQEDRRVFSIADEKVRALKRMLRLDSAMVQEEHLLSKERAVTDELISLGALTEAQLTIVLRERQQQDEAAERRWGKATKKHGAMGDVISDLFAPFPQASASD